MMSIYLQSQMKLIYVDAYGQRYENCKFTDGSAFDGRRLDDAD